MSHQWHQPWKVPQYRSEGSFGKLLQVTRPKMNLLFVKSLATSCFYAFGIFTLARGGPQIADAEEETELHIGALLPFTGVWPGGEAMLASAELALQRVNADPSILPGYRLNITHSDSQFKVYEGTQRLHEMLTSGPVKTAILAAANSELSESSGLVSNLWNLVCVSYASVSPVLSDKKTFPRFFRTSSPDTAVTPGRVYLMKEFGWQKIALLHQSRAVFDAVADDLKKKFHENNLTLIADEVFQYDPAPQVASLKERDARIIITITNVDKALLIFCEAYKKGMYGPQFVWFVSGWFDDNWYTQVLPDVDCTREELIEAAEGSMGIGDLTLNPSNEPGISGITSAEWQELYDITTNYTRPHASILAPQAFDAVWAIALALNATESQLITAGSPKRLASFRYEDTDVSDMIYANMKAVRFDGAKSPIFFDTNQDPVIMTKINRVQGGVRQLVGIYYPDSGDGPYIEWSTETPLQWKSGRPPADATTYVNKKEFVSTAVYGVFCLLSGIGILLAMFFLAINVKYRHVRIIKMSSPNINNLILLGCILMYTSVFIQELNSSTITVFCRIRNFMTLSGFALVFGALFSKTWRIHIIFANKQMKRKVVKDWELAIITGILLAIDLAVLVVWEIVDPQKLHVTKLREEETADGDTILVYFLERCRTTHRIYFVGTLYIIQGLLLVFGAFLAFETRKVTIPALNDSQQIGMCIYNVMILSIMAVIMSFVLSEKVQLSYSLISAFIIIGTTMTQCLIFIPKILKLKESKVAGEQDDSTTSTLKSQATTTITVNSKDNCGTTKDNAGTSKGVKVDDEALSAMEKKLKEAEKLVLEKEGKIRELERKLQTVTGMTA